MCGIAGFQGSFDPQQLTQMTDALAHRGPDDSGTAFLPDARTGLGHRRLSILDLSAAGHQPMWDCSKTAAIVFNGEIYNFRDLHYELRRAAYPFKGHSDTEVLIALYMSRGREMLPQLNGIFAFAVFDYADQSLFLACDRMGVKPLYYGETRHGFFFSSELKSLLASRCIEPDLDVATLYRTLGFLWSPGGTTPLKGIRRLGPGEALIVRDGRIQRFWKWAKSAWGTEAPPLDRKQAVTEVQKALRTAVHRQLVADVPVGAFLSGGLDSSAIVAMAREATPSIECFTINTGESAESGLLSDLPYARRVASHLGVRLYEIAVNSSDMAAGFERMVYQLDEPLADPAPLNVLYISQLAREHGIKVLLSGAGGDDLFSGYRRHRALALERYWSWLPVSIRAALRQSTAVAVRYGAAGRRLAKAFSNADSSRTDRLLRYFLWLDPLRIRSLFAAHHQSLLTPEALTAPLQDFLLTLPNGVSDLDRMLALEQRFFLADHNLLYTDKMSMAVGVEVRVPFLDNDLLALANRLRPSLKQSGGTAKWILKKAMLPYLPEEVIYRPKTGFGAPIRHWLRHELKDMISDLLSPSVLRRRGIFDPVAVTRLIEDDRASRIDATYSILAIACIELWCRSSARVNSVQVAV